ncbi:uncharacterized protein [Chironomus tepperi]|uniref:uncharacterized protein n=1 Tax=Chironomus tepperi TaxID=113505 RepID=UPI00391FA8F2
MKLLVITIALFFAYCEGAVDPKSYILSPDFLMNTAKAHQAAAQKLQDEFDEAYLAANGLISSILGGTMVNKLNVYKNHTDDLLVLYNPVFESLDILPIDDCRNNVYVMLQSILGTTGSSGGLCSKNYYADTSKAANGVTDNINGLNKYYIQLSTFVYHSFAGNNALVDSESIEQAINSTYAELVDKLKFDSVDTDAFRATLAAIDTKFKNCLNTAESHAVNMIAMAEYQIDICKDLHDVSRASRGVRNVQFKSLLPEFEEYVNSIEEYKW